MIDIRNGDEYANGHKLVGAVSLRQLRIIPNDCFIPTQFRQTIQTCYPSSFVENTANFGPPSQPNK
jgi:hypothetical protein